MKRAAILSVLLAATAAHADDAPRVEIEDLPPLPDEQADQSSTNLAVLSATNFGEDVVVGAAKREQSLGNVASAVTVVSGDRLRRMGYRTVSEALRSVAGMYVDDDHLTDRVGVRGLQVLGDFNTRLLLLVDGATVNEPWNQFTGFGWDTPFAIDDIARIEVIRGPVSSVYGTNAFFGIINVVTRGAAESPRAWGRITGGTFGGSASAGFSAGDVDHQLRGSVSALGRLGEPLAVDELGGIDEADGATALRASVAGAYEGAFGQVRFYRRVRELPFAPYETLIGSPENTSADTLFMSEAGYTRELSSRLTTTVRGYFNRYRYRDRLLLADGSGTFTDTGDSRWFGGEVRGRYALADDDKLGITAGGEVTFISTESRSFYYGDEANAAIVPKDFNLQGLYAEVDAQPLPWFALTAGVRADRNSVLEDRVSPRAALFVSQKDRYGAKLLYAEGFRNPSAYEGFFDDGVDFIGNDDIGAETIRSYEVVLWDKPRPGLTVRLSGFRWAAKRLVEQESLMLPDGSERLQFQNTGGLVSTGAEVEASYRDADGWLAFGGFAYARVENDAGEAAIGSPPLTGSVGASSPLLAKRFHLSSEVQVVSPRLVRKADEADPDCHTKTWVGWNAALYLPSWSGFDLTVGARNLLGLRQETPSPEDFDRDDGETVIAILPGEGRELYARLGYRY